MSSLPLSTRSLLELVDLFEQSSQSISDMEGQCLLGVPGWELSRRKALSDRDLSAWTECVGYAGYYPAPCGDSCEPVELQEDEDATRFSYRCPETFRKKYLPAEMAAVHAITATKFLNYVADLLAIPQALRQGIATPAIDDVLWHLGKMRIADTQVNVWLVRGLAPLIEQVFDHFQTVSLPEQGLIFTTGSALPSLVHPPRDYRIIPISQVLVEHAVNPQIDVDLIHRLLLTSLGAGMKKSLPVRFDPYSSTLVIATKSHKPWVIKGIKQVAVVRYLFEQYSNGRRWVPAHEILSAVYGNKKLGRSQRIQNIFSGNTQWEDYIANDGHGHYGFNLD